MLPSEGSLSSEVRRHSPPISCLSSSVRANPIFRFLNEHTGQFNLPQFFQRHLSGLQSACSGIIGCPGSVQLLTTRMGQVKNSLSQIPGRCRFTWRINSWTRNLRGFHQSFLTTRPRCMTRHPPQSVLNSQQQCDSVQNHSKPRKHQAKMSPDGYFESCLRTVEGHLC